MTTFAKISNSGAPPNDQVLIWKNLIYQQFNTLAVQGNLSPENNLILRVVPLAHNRPLMWKIWCLAKHLHTHSLLTFVALKPTACEIKSICQKLHFHHLVQIQKCYVLIFPPLLAVHPTWLIVLLHDLLFSSSCSKSAPRSWVGFRGSFNM